MSSQPDEAPEFSRLFDVRQLPTRQILLEASAAECAALAARLDLRRLTNFSAQVKLVAGEGGSALATGRFSADVVQGCAISGEDVPAHIAEPLALRFVPLKAAPARADDALELTAEELDEITFAGASFDLGEEIAQSLALALDPFPCGPNADRFRKAAGILDEEAAKRAASPFAALANIKSD